MAALKERTQGEIEFVGVGGQAMERQGLESLADLAELSVNGFFQPLAKLPSLLRLFRRLTKELASADLDAFIGVDFNVFNFLLENALRKRGVKTAHYVSPSVYAWRKGRTKRVAEVAEMILCLFPFEPAFYKDTDVEPVFVGHPLADAIAMDAGDADAKQAARAELGMPLEQPVLAVLPGSRSQEVRMMLPEFVRAADIFCRTHAAHVVVPCPRPGLRSLIEEGFSNAEFSWQIVDDTATQTLKACDIALVKSGTSTLETMLLHRPMVVSYRVGPVSYQIARRLMQSEFLALPNILAGKQLVPEILQYEASGENLARALSEELQKSRSDEHYFRPFLQLHEQLSQQADSTAANAVLRLMRDGSA